MELCILFLFVGLSFCGANPLDSALQCGDREEHSSCTNGGCVARDCSQLGTPVPCVRIDPKFCLEGCVCKAEYLRDFSGDCVKKNQCEEAIQCSGNEEFSSCKNGGCDARNCTQLGRPVPCLKMDPKYCIKGCVCKTGYLRATNGECVKKDQCHTESCKCTGPHEYFACGSACDTECATLYQTCPIINIKCNEMCYCEKGYARNAKHVCVPIDQCT